MSAQSSLTTKEFTGVRVEVTTPLSFDEVLKRLRNLVGHASASDIVAIAKNVASEADYAREVEKRFIGESGFMLFSEIDHGSWTPIFGLRRRAVRWIFGNPLIAITMLRHDIAVGLFVPVELLLVNNPAGGAILIYVRPSSLIAVDDNPELLAAARALDAKFEALVARATASA